MNASLWSFWFEPLSALRPILGPDDEDDIDESGHADECYGDECESVNCECPCHATAGVEPITAEEDLGDEDEGDELAAEVLVSPAASAERGRASW